LYFSKYQVLLVNNDSFSKYTLKFKLKGLIYIGDTAFFQI